MTLFRAQKYLFLEAPFSRSAVWCWRAAFFSFCLAGIGLLASRRGLEPAAVLIILGSAVFFAFMALPLGLAGFATIWVKGSRGTVYIIPGLLLAIALLSLPVYLAAQNIGRPRLAGLSTGADVPPPFSLSRAAMQARRLQMPPALSEKAEEFQTLRIDLDGAAAYAMVLKAAAQCGWQIIESHAPGGRMGYGHIDAIARSPVLRFENDVSIRLVPIADETLMDVRAASRPGTWDLGQNAKLIEDFLGILRDEADKSE